VGFFLGVVLTISCAYAYDSATGKAGNGLAANDQAPMVNWSVVDSDWQIFKANIRTTVDDLGRAVRRLTG
jgi:rubredoxin